MKRFKNVLTLLLLIFACLLNLTGCGETQNAEKTVSGMFEAFKSLEFEKAKTYVDYNEFKISDNKDSITGDIDLLMKNLFNKLDYKIISSEKNDNKNVIVKTEITAIDMKPIMSEVFSNALQIAFANALASKDQQLSEEDTYKKIEEIFIQSLSKPDLKTVTNTVDINVVKTKDGWKVNVDETMTNALFGGLKTVINDMGKTFRQNIN